MKYLFRFLIILIGLTLLAEFGLRLNGYHLTVKYQREGDLLFAPRPNQKVMEKIALTPTQVNNFGVRGHDFEEKIIENRSVILCLGDSITYGYGVDDDSTYPSFIQKALDQKKQDAFLVVNAGVNAYPISLMTERYKRLHERGIDPDVVIVGYSMNEGFLGQISEGSEEVKSAFEKRIILKNTLRSIGLYNLVIENWARTYYDKYKSRFIPGTNQVARKNEESQAEDVTSTPQDPSDLYKAALEKMALTFQANPRIKKVIAVCSAAHNAQTDDFNSTSPFHQLFREAAQKYGWVLIPSDEVLRSSIPHQPLNSYFIDRCHMNPNGNRIVGEALGNLISETTKPSLQP